MRLSLKIHLASHLLETDSRSERQREVITQFLALKKITKKWQ